MPTEELYGNYNFFRSGEIYRAALAKPFLPQWQGANRAQIEGEVQRAFPRGVDAVVYTKSAIQGWSQVPNNKGIIAILIGLFMPGNPQSGLPAGKRMHTPFLKPGGEMGFAVNVNGRLEIRCDQTMPLF